MDSIRSVECNIAVSFHGYCPEMYDRVHICMFKQLFKIDKVKNKPSKIKANYDVIQAFAEKLD